MTFSDGYRIAASGRYWGRSGHGVATANRWFVTQSGHKPVGGSRRPRTNLESPITRRFDRACAEENQVCAPCLRYLGSTHWTRELGSASGFANNGRVTLFSPTRVDPLPASRPCWPPHDRFYILRY